MTERHAAVRVGDELMDVVGDLHRTVRRRLRPRMPGPELRGAQVQLLRAVEAEPGIGVSGAARVLHLADNSVSTLVNQLVAVDMLVRERDPADRRAARLQVTAAARRRLDAWRSQRSALVAEVFADLPEPDVAAIDAAIPALRRVLERFADEQTVRGAADDDPAVAERHPGR